MIWELINRNSIKKDNEPILYSRIKEELLSKQSKCNEILTKLNWEVVIDPDMILLKKSISSSEGYMGIQTFKDKTDYVFLTGIYYYLHANQDIVFAAEDLIENLKIIFEKENINIDISSIAMKYSLYRALMYCEKQEYVKKLDGDAAYLIEDNPMTDGVLYLNSGHIRNLGIKAQTETTQNTVYRSLILKPIIYFNDYNINMKRYIREHLTEIEDDMRYLFGSDINLIFQEKIAAILIPANGEIRSGKRDLCREFPKNNMTDLILLRMATYIRNYIILKQKQERDIYITRYQYLSLIKKMKKNDNDWWTKEYQNMSLGQLEKITLKGLAEWNAISYNEKHVMVLPLVSMIQGELV